jgi:hypothetical protein
MDEISEFRKLLKEIMDRDSESILSPEEIYFESLVIEVIEMVDERWVAWMN